MPELVMDASCRDNRWTAYLCTWPPGCSPLMLPPINSDRAAQLSTAHTVGLRCGASLSADCGYNLMPQSPDRLRNDLKCVEWDIKPYHTHTLGCGSCCLILGSASSPLPHRLSWYWDERLDYVTASNCYELTCLMVMQQLRSFLYTLYRM